jgi:hypothetical protein
MQYNNFAFTNNFKLINMFGDMMGMMGKLRETQQKIAETKKLKPRPGRRAKHRRLVESNHDRKPRDQKHFHQRQPFGRQGTARRLFDFGHQQSHSKGHEYQ